MATRKATKKRPGSRIAAKKDRASKNKAKSNGKKVMVEEERKDPETIPDVVTNGHDDQVDSLYSGAMQQAYARLIQNEDQCVQSNISVLREIEYIDMRELSNQDRFCVLATLDHEGYVTFDLNSLLGPANLSDFMQVDMLRLQHQNKLVAAAWAGEASDNQRISRPTVRLDVQIGFSQPASIHPEMIQVGDAHYVRVM